MRLLLMLCILRCSGIFGREDPLLLLIAYDGIRYDFVNEILTPNLWRLCRNGVWSPTGMKPQIVTSTAPNFYSIVTGLYQENHGVVGNRFYDPHFDEIFDYWNLDEPEKQRRSFDAKWYGGEPVWQVRQKLFEVDELTGYLMQQLERLNLKRSMNVIFVSDHGHSSVCEKEKINFDHYMNPADYIYSSGSFFLTKNSSLTVKSLYTTLNEIRMKQPKFHLWLKSDIPDRFRYKRNRRIGPVFVMPFLGHNISPYDEFILSFSSVHNEECHGDHGYSSEYMEMRPFFAAFGPAFKSNFIVTKPIENIDLYNLMCMVLNLQPAPNNGSLDRVIGLLKNSYKR